MENLITNLLLPVLGVLIILFCIFSYFLPYGAKFKGQIQKIKAFGMNLELSKIRV